MAAIPKDFRLETIMRVEQISAHISDRAGGFVEAISLLAEKKKLPHCFTRQLYVCLFLSESCLFLI